MNKESYNNQIINEYLLGSLPEAEIEAFDELSFTDDRFADALRIAEKDLVDAYVQGELTGTQLEQFKSYYLASPRRLEKVRFAQAFQVFAEKKGLARAAQVETENAAERTAKRKKSGWLSAFSNFSGPRLALQWGMAFVALALLIAGIWLGVENARLRQQISQTEARREALSERETELQKQLDGERSVNSKTAEELARVREERERLERDLKQQEAERLAEGQREARLPSPNEKSIASFILSPQMRGARQIQTVSISAQTAYVAMRLELEPNDFPTYSVALLGQPGDRALWRSGRLRARGADESKALNVSFRASLLKPQAYLLRVTGFRADGSSEILSDYLFKVVK